MKKTHSIIVVDRSGSMQATSQSAVMGFNENVQQVKEFANEDNHDIRVSLITFNGQVFEHFWGVEATSLEEATVEGFQPSGSTNLYEAIGYVLDRSLREDDGETAYLVTVISDGGHNCEGKYSQQEVRELSERAQATGRWTISYIGYSPENAHEVAEACAIPQGNIAMWCNTDMESATRGMRATRSVTKSYLSAREVGETSMDTLYSTSENSHDCFQVKNLSAETPSEITCSNVTPPSQEVPSNMTTGKVDYFGTYTKATSIA